MAFLLPFVIIVVTGKSLLPLTKDFIDEEDNTEEDDTKEDEEDEASEDELKLKTASKVTSFVATQRIPYPIDFPYPWCLIFSMI